MFSDNIGGGIYENDESYNNDAFIVLYLTVLVCKIIDQTFKTI